jgi:O-antigen/teichoic acid export membrane protein
VPGGAQQQRISPRLVLDLATGYLAVLARIGSWVVITAIAYRQLAARYFAALVAVRSTLTLLNYLAMGLGPATVYFLSQQLRRPTPAIPVTEADCEPVEQSGTPILPYRSLRDPSESRAVVSAFFVAGMAAICIAIFANWAYDHVDLFFNTVTHTGSQRALRDSYADLFWAFAIAAAVRLLSEPWGALLQWSKWISLDNLLIIASELIFCGFALEALRPSPFRSGGGWDVVQQIGPAAVDAALFLLATRIVIAMAADVFGLIPRLLIHVFLFDRRLLAVIARFAGLIALAQLADYLYAPTDYLLINHLLPAAAAVAYTPAVQIDSGLLLLVSAVGAVLLPRAAAAYGQRQIGHVRRIYLLGTLGCTAAMVLAAAIVLIFSRPLLSVWYGQDMPATRAILPLILVSTVVGGSSAAGRSVLLAAGRTRAYTAAALLAGIANVVLSFCFVRFGHMGLAGIVLGTVIVVVARCGIWMPWYVLQTLRHPSPNAAEVIPVPISAP